MTEHDILSEGFDETIEERWGASRNPSKGLCDSCLRYRPLNFEGNCQIRKKVDILEKQTGTELIVKDCVLYKAYERKG